MMRRGQRILLVDDAVATRRRIAQVLRAIGFEVTEASEGVEGLYKARATAFDMVITDIHMPAMDGLAFLRELRKLDEYQRTPILVLSSDASKDRIQEVRQAGGSAWIEKSANLTNIAELVRSTMESVSSSVDR